MKEFYSNGKLLLTGEYVVLDGALSLAIPTKFGQSLKITSFEEPRITWKSLDFQDQIWFETAFKLINNEILKHVKNDSKMTNRLLDILNSIKKLNPDFLNSGYHIETKLTFPNNWGLGSSSTLINNIAKWAKVDAYQVLEQTFGGSGYDIACAQYNSPITYQRIKKNERHIEEVNFNPTFKDTLYFVYLNKKQNSRDGIKLYQANNTNKTEAINKINVITSELITCKNLANFELLLNQHETIISDIIKQTPVKEKLFSDFNGSIKSLGAWGGDFVLVTSKVNPETYFNAKGYYTIIPYSEMIK